MNEAFLNWATYQYINVSPRFMLGLPQGLSKDWKIKFNFTQYFLLMLRQTYIYMTPQLMKQISFIIWILCSCNKSKHTSYCSLRLREWISCAYVITYLTRTIFTQVYCWKFWFFHVHQHFLHHSLVPKYEKYILYITIAYNTLWWPVT